MSRPSTREEDGRRVERLIEEIEPGHMVVLKRSAERGQWEVLAVGTVSLSEAMKARSINTNTFYLEVDGAPCATCVTTTTKVPATVRYNDDTKTAVLNPTNPLAPNTTYTATVEGTGDGDMVAVKDRGGTPMATDYTFSFTTGSGCQIGCE